MAFADQLDKIKEQEWYQQAKANYDQLPTEQQTYVKWGSFGAVLLLLLYLTFTTVDLAGSAKNDYFDKQELSDVVSKANDEIRRLKGQNAGFAQNTGAQNWKAIMAGLVTQQSLSPDALEITKETPGALQGIIQETLIEAKFKNVNTRQLTGFLYAVEHGNPPMKLKGMKIDSDAKTGSLSGSLNISGYLPKPEKGDKSK
jgi:hypothetical protein